MSRRYFLYAVLVTVMTSCSSWTNMFRAASSPTGGSGWSSHSGGGYSGGYSGGGGHK